MARRDGDWDCPECGSVVFASRTTCFRCEKAASAGGTARRDGDWNCPDCGVVNFASRETCFKCDPSTRKKEGDWECPDCGANNFANRETCFQCDKRGSSNGGKGGGKKKAAGKNSTATATPAAAGATTPNSMIKALAKMAPQFKKAWVAYCKAWGEGFSDPAKYDEEFITQFVDYAGGVLFADIEKQQEAPAEDDWDEDAAAPPAKRQAAKPAADAPATKVAKKATGAAAAATPGGKKATGATAAPAATPAEPAVPAGEKKKLTMRKSVGDEIRRLNAAGILSKPIRPGAVAGKFAQIDEATSLEVLAMVEEQHAEIEDANEFLNSQIDEKLSEA